MVAIELRVVARNSLIVTLFLRLFVIKDDIHDENQCGHGGEQKEDRREAGVAKDPK